MNNKHNFVRLAEVQRQQKTLYCAGLDVHPFGSFAANMKVYNSVLTSPEEEDRCNEAQKYYLSLLPFFLGERLPLSLLLASVEGCLMKVIDIMVHKCGIRVFKPQSAFYEQFGPVGLFLLSRIHSYIKDLELQTGEQMIVILDCKRGDTADTQAAYFTGLFGNLQDDWGIDYAPFDFDIINVTPWMGSDVMCFGAEGKPGLGLKLMRQGKGIIVVSKSSNPSGPEYQELIVGDGAFTVQSMNVQRMSEASSKYDLDYDGLSAIGLVVGSTHACTGSIRTTFPTTTLLVPGFGAQGGKFSLIMLELIREGKWNGQGAIFSSSRGTMYPWMEKLGGSGKIENLETDLIKAVDQFRVNEKKAYEAMEVQRLGIEYPFALAA